MPNIFRTGRPTNFKLGTQTEYEDPYHLQVQRSWSQSHVMRVTVENKTSYRINKIGSKVVLEITRISFKVKRSRSPGRLLLRPEVYHIYGTRTPTNFKTAMPLEHAINCHGIKLAVANIIKLPFLQIRTHPLQCRS